jgi:hypothetical protein
MTKKKVATPPATVIRSTAPVAQPPAKTDHPWRARGIPEAVYAAAERQGGRVKVRATKMGWYNVSRRRIGDVFVLATPEHFSTTWMELEADHVPLQRTLGKAALAQEHADIMRGRSPRLQPNAADLEEDEPRAAIGDEVASHPPDPESPLE